MTILDFILNNKNYLEDLITKSTYHSNAIEGSTLTYAETINYELLKNNLPPVVIAKEDRVKYFEFLRNNEVNGLAEWLKELSTREDERWRNSVIKIK